MIKFFSKIRYNLMEQNKTGRYFKYAIGEIVLVVIGILIALQINNWNSKRQIKENNKIFLNKLIHELELNKKRMARLAFENDKGASSLISLEQAIKTCDSIMIMTYRGLQESDLDFILNNERGAGGSYLNLHDGTFEELINTGKLYTLGSDSLINAIKSYYKRCEREDLYNKGNSENAESGYEILMDGLGKLEMDYYQDSLNFNLKNYPWFLDKTSVKYQNMQMGLNLMQSGQTANFIKMQQIIKYSDSLIVKINAELKEYHD